ncbi:hypothetical protein SCHPADRAFT_561126 [Schizopora paradoxa]|uniref:Uncharacterized protein n=1 Tax=Schizopora paradoxa TaxID=27342 RepID=A0A0H2RCP8_9AGAM|nr:hypothetical protein SCHPADRAFT_561126 [Schizopora paradoxa]
MTIVSTTSSLECLPLDVRDRLLTTLPSFASLRAAVLSCTALYEAYSFRKHSIFNAVVENEAGPALLEALAVSRATKDLDVYSKEDEINDKFADKEGPYWRNEVSVGDAYEVGIIAQVASELEDLFSFRYKDRSRTDSSFSYAESCVFRRALYHNWILSLLSRASTPEDEVIDDDDFIDENTCSLFVRVLSDLDDKSLSQLYQVLLFLDEVFVRSSSRQSYNSKIGKVHLASIPLRTRQYAPPKVLIDFKEQSLFNDLGYDTRATEAVAMGFDSIIRKREVPRIFEEILGRQAILEGVSGGYVDECEPFTRQL